MSIEQTKIWLQRWGRRLWALPRLRKLDLKRIPKRKPEEVWLFLVCRNEALRLPAMLDYHFQLGVSRAIVVDNGSTDDTLPYLLSQSRVHVFETKQSFAGNKLAWQELMLRRFGQGYWNLVLDADELFVYPNMQRDSLPSYVQALEQEGAQALHAIFLEMFSREPISEVRYHAHQDLLAAAPYFDGDGYCKKKYRPVFDQMGSAFVYMGGARARVFGGEFGCSKIPLLKYAAHQFLRLGFHTIEGARLSSHQGAVLHFKYLQDFHEKVRREAQRQVYWNGASEYKAYAALLEQNPLFSLWHPAAIRFESWQTLAQAGLIN